MYGEQSSLTNLEIHLILLLSIYSFHHFVIQISANAFKHLPQPLRSANYFIVMGGGGPQIQFLVESLYFCYLGAHAKSQNPTKPFLGEKQKAQRERRKRKFPLTPMGVLTHRLQTHDVSLVTPST